MRGSLFGAVAEQALEHLLRRIGGSRTILELVVDPALGLALRAIRGDASGRVLEDPSEDRASDLGRRSAAGAADVAHVEGRQPELARLGIGLLLAAPGSTNTAFKANVIDQQQTPPWAVTRGVPPDQVAKQIADAMQRRRDFVIPNRKGWWMVMVNRVAPWLIDRAVRPHG